MPPPVKERDDVSVASSTREGDCVSVPLSVGEEDCVSVPLSVEEEDCVRNCGANGSEANMLSLNHPLGRLN
ncbi:hypothetical protein ACOMHN_042243 [Nucella lapillus]